MTGGRRLARWVPAAAALLTSAGCSSAVSVAPAPDAADPLCARVVAAFPTRVGDADRRATTAQASVAWGRPPVVARCGVTPPGPTTDPCQHVQADGEQVDWVVRSGSDGSATWVTFGRVPAVEFTVPPGQVVPGDVAIALGPAVSLAPSRATCPA